MTDIVNMEKDVRQDASPLLKSLIEEKVLEKWQNYFCDAANVFMCCVDSSGFPITGFSGREEDVARIKEIIDKEQFQDMLQRVSESALEEQAIETTAYPNLRLALISARVGGKAVVNWFVCGVLSDVQDAEDYENPPLEGFAAQISEKQFAKVVDVLKALTDDMLKYRFSEINAREESRQSRNAEREMKESLKRMDALAEVIQFLDSDETAEQTAYKLLKKVGELYELDAVALYTISKSRKRFRVIAKWCEKGREWELEKAADAAGRSFLKAERVFILSQDSMLDVEEREEMQKLGLKAVIVMPVNVSTARSTCVCFCEMEKERTWKLEEIKFLNACVKVLHSILQRKSSL